MKYLLRASVESSWRGPVLDGLRKVFEVGLESRVDMPGYISIEKTMGLDDGAQVRVYCSVSPDGLCTLSVSAGDREVLNVLSQGPLTVSAQLPDRMIYEFQLLAGPAL